MDDINTLTCDDCKDKFHTVNHVIFDLDGILLDSEGIYTQMFSMICARYDKVYTHKLREKIMGTTERDSAAMIVHELGLPLTPEEFLNNVHTLQTVMLPQVQLMPGAEMLIRHFHKNGVPIAVATSSSQPGLDLKLTNHKELFSLFSHIVAAGTDPEVNRGKPAPDVFLVCASRFPKEPQPSKCLVFEDAPNGVKAAVAAGMQVVMVPEEQIEEELRKGATMVLRSLEDFKPQLFGLPPL